MKSFPSQTSGWGHIARSIGTSVLDGLFAADARYRAARHILELDEHMLSDIGATRDALIEASGLEAGSSRQRSFWRALAASRVLRRRFQ